MNPYKLVAQRITPLGEIYGGPAELAVWEIRMPPEPDRREWIAQRLLTTAEEKIKEVALPLWIKVYREGFPAYTMYKIEAMAVGSPIPWLPIIIGVTVLGTAGLGYLTAKEVKETVVASPMTAPIMSLAFLLIVGAIAYYVLVKCEKKSSSCWPSSPSFYTSPGKGDYYPLLLLLLRSPPKLGQLSVILKWN